MVAFDSLCLFMEKVCLIDFHRSDSHNRFKRAFHLVQISLLLLYPCFSLLSSVTRASRYGPELVQTTNEFSMMCALTFLVIYLASQHRRVDFLVRYMQNEFSRAHNEIHAACHDKGRIIFCCFLALGIAAGICSMLEALLPMSEAELEIHRRVYRTKHPERRLLYMIKIPFVDESESWAFEAIFAVELYLTVVYSILFAIGTTYAPILMIHFRGQYEMLCKYVVLIGREHKDRDGTPIRYTSIEKNEFVRDETCRGVGGCHCSSYGRRRLQVDEKPKVEAFAQNLVGVRRSNMVTCKRVKTVRCTFAGVEKVGQSRSGNRGNVVTRKRVKTVRCTSAGVEKVGQSRSGNRAMDELYEAQFLRQIVIFHQKLIRFQEELFILLYPMAFQIIIVNSLIFSLCLYQLVLDPSQLSTTRLVKFIAEFVAVAFEYLLILNASDMAAECNTLMCRAITNSGWSAVSNRTRRQLCLVLLRVQVDNHFKMWGQTLVLSRSFYLRVMRLAYSFVNYMNIMSRK